MDLLRRGRGPGGRGDAAPGPPDGRVPRPDKERWRELDESLVVGAHRVLLRRDPTDEERRSWVDHLQTDLLLEEMVCSLLESEEFLVRYEELRRRAGLAADERERLAVTRRLAALEERVEALMRAEEMRDRGRDRPSLLDRPAG